MRILYDIFFVLFSLFYLPYFIIKGKYHGDYMQRFGVFKKGTFSGVSSAGPIWLHAVSVGEMKAGKILLDKLRAIFPSRRFVISNVTKTGHDVASSAAAEGDVVIYFPMDLSFVTRRLIRLIRPSLFISIETEIWPNLIRGLKVGNIPVVLMNGRISPGSFRNYRLIKPVIRRVLADIDLFCMRTETDASRIIDLGAPPDRIKVTGDMKFDGVDIEDKGGAGGYPTVKSQSAWLAGPPELIIAGSTHRGEEAVVLRCYKKLKKVFPGLRLLIAPRHIERAAEVSAMVRKFGLKSAAVSDIEKRFSGLADSGDRRDSVLVLDSMGRLGMLYGLAAVVFMGGSLVPRGGHNFIEPAAWGKPIVTGPYVHNFRDMAELFVADGALEFARGEAGLLESLKALLSDKKRRLDMGERAKGIVFRNRGATDRNISLIRRFL